MEVILSGHAVFEAKRRDIEEDLIRTMVMQPQQKISSKKGRVIIQGKYYDQFENKEMLLRIIGKETLDNFEVITVYKTSKFKKYWLEGGRNEGDL
ncbi:MAG: hypothetical protein HYV59_10290 [Planctomycetes bacterium]|nr:hypothetical protein [Planctomycetota bacterium]